MCKYGFTDHAPNISTGDFFAAFRGPSSTFPGAAFGSGAFCGMCVDLTLNGKTITATVIDACATCTSGDGHLDSSLAASSALGLDQGSTQGDVKNVTWKSVACPVTTNIVAVYNGASSNGQVYFQNVRYPVAKAVVGSHTASQAFGYWDFGAQVAGMSVTLTDIAGHTATGTLPTSSGSIGAQFCP